MAYWSTDGEFGTVDELYAYNQPHLYHLARLDEQYPRYAAVLTDTNTARIFVFGLGHVIDAEQVRGKKVHRVKVGGWSQARYQRRVGNAHQEHAKEVIERLVQIVREDQVSHIILAGDSVVIPLLQEQLPPEMVSMVEIMKLDIHASEHDIVIATLEQLQEQEVKTAAEKVDRLMHQYRARGLAVVGLHETLEALANGQVEELLITALWTRAILYRRTWRQFSRRRSPIRREERKATNRGKRPCPIYWLPKPSRPAQS